MTKDRAWWEQRIAHRIIAATPVPLEADGALAVKAQDAYAAWLCEQPIAGVAAWAHTGRGLHLPTEAADAVMRSWRAALGPDRVLVAGVGGAPGNDTPEKWTAATMRMAERALNLGADGFLVYPPVICRGRPDEHERVVAHHRKLAELDAPMIAFYLYEPSGGISYRPETLREILALPQVVGIKMATLDSVMTFQEVACMLKEEFPHLILITGEDRMLGYSLIMGARAALIGMGATCTKLQADMFDAYFASREDNFLKLCRQVDLLGETLFAKPVEQYLIRVLWALAASGVIPEEAANDPWAPPLERSEIERVKAVVRQVCG